MPTTNFVNGSTITDAAWFNDVDALVYEGTFPSGITNLNPDANDGAAIGTSGTAWSDLFLASGAVINFDAGNYTITHSAGALTLSGALTVNGTSLVFGAGGTDSAAHTMDLNGSSTNLYGPQMRFRRNSVTKAFIGTESVVVGNNNDNLLLYAIAGQQVKIYSNAGVTATFDASNNTTLTGTLTVSGNTVSGSAAGTLRADGGIRIGADSTNNLLDDASTGAGTATLYIGNASINVTSDERVKSNIRPIEDGLAIVNALLPIEFDQDEERPFGDQRHYMGFGARHSHKVAPWAVHTQGDTGLPWKMRQEFLMAPVVRAMQQLCGRIEALEARL